MFERSEILYGKEFYKKLSDKKVAIFGLGGVGGFVFEGLVRNGISNFLLVDADKFEESNLNRQILSNANNLGKAKVDVAKEHGLSIRKDLNIETKEVFFSEETLSSFDFSDVDYIVDCIDSIKSKILLIEIANKYNIPIISSMGAGNRYEPNKLMITDIFKTSGDPIAKILRKALKDRDIKHLKVGVSLELPIKREDRVIASAIFVPGSMGLLLASEVIKDLLK